MKTIQSIREAIKKAPENMTFTKLGYEPIFMANPKARILIVGQAPGIKTQLKKSVFMDKSGDILREWMGISYKTFYESGLIAVLPLDFYYPGKAKTGDLPPRKEFAKLWHPHIIELMPEIQLTLLVGGYAQRAYLGKRAKKNLTETVFAYQDYLPEYFPLVHPSPLNFRWHLHNPKFKQDIVPNLQVEIQRILNIKIK